MAPASVGIPSEDIRIDWPALMRFKRTFTEPVPADREQQFLQTGIAVFHGRVRFSDKTSIQVGDDTLIGRFVLVAAGDTAHSRERIFNDK